MIFVAAEGFGNDSLLPDLVTLPEMPDWRIDLAQLTGLPPWFTLGVGATNGHPSEFPPDFQSVGINPRSEPRNALIGSTVSHPTDDEIVVGVTFFDTHDKSDNEDYYVYSLSDSVIRKLAASEFERRYPQYAATHRGFKDYLRGSGPPPAGGAAT